MPIAGLDDDPAGFGSALGLRPGVEMVGDPGLTLHERLWFRPSLTVIGIDGHPIKGSSNQIVARASAPVLRASSCACPCNIACGTEAPTTARSSA